MSNKSCSTCENTARVMGNSFVYLQQDPRNHVQCTLEAELKEIGEKHRWDNLKMPEVCGRYEPRMIKECTYCGKEMNKPEHEWNLFASPTSAPVCSKDCQTKKEGAQLAMWFAD